MSEPFLPPMPEPSRRLPWPAAVLLHLHHDLLGLVTERAYRAQVMDFGVLGQRIVIVNHPEVVRHVFVLKHEIYQRKSAFKEQALAPVVGDSLFIGHGPVWAERRAAVAPLLHPSEIGRFHPLFVQAAEELVADWATSSAPRDIAPDLAAATARVVALALFGAQVPRSVAREVARDFAAYENAVAIADLPRLMGLPAWLGGAQPRAAREAAARIRALAARLTGAGPAGPLLDGMAAARRPDGTPVLAGEALLNETVMILLAASETSANALAWALYLAAAHPPTFARLRREADHVLGGRPAPGPEELAALPFTRAVLQEAMRLYPPVAILARQALGADRIRHVEVRPGATVLCVLWLLHRHAELWDASHEFRPERFMPEALQKPRRFSYVPFGLGPRVCAGSAFGMAEMTVFLAALAARFDLAPAPDHAPMPRLRLTLRPRDGIRLILKPRG